MRANTQDMEKNLPRLPFYFLPLVALDSFLSHTQLKKNRSICKPNPLKEINGTRLPPVSLLSNSQDTVPHLFLYFPLLAASDSFLSHTRLKKNHSICKPNPLKETNDT